MALGDVTTISPDAVAIEVLATVGAANGAPTGTAGIEANAVKSLLGKIPPSFRVAVMSTAGSGTMTATVRVWQRLGAAGWVVSKSLNGGSAIAETGTDSVAYSEQVDVIAGADRYYVELVAVAGTTPSYKALIIVDRSQF